MKNVLSLMLAAIMLFSMLGSAFAAASDDVPLGEQITLNIITTAQSFKPPTSPVTTIGKVVVVKHESGERISDASVSLSILFPDGTAVNGVYSGYKYENNDNSRGYYAFDISIPSQYRGQDVSVTATASATRLGRSSSLTSTVTAFGSTGVVDVTPRVSSIVTEPSYNAPISPITTIGKVTVVNTNGNPISDASVSLRVQMPNGVFVSGNFISYQNGYYRFELETLSYYRGRNVSAMATATATKNGLSSTLSSPVIIYGVTTNGTAGGEYAAPVIKTITTEQSFKPPESPITTIGKVMLVDGNNNLVSDATVSFKLQMPNGERVTGNYASYQNGYYRFELPTPSSYRGRDVSAVATVIATKNGNPSARSSTVTIFGSSGVEYATKKLSITTVGSTRMADYTYVYAKVVDEKGNAVNGAIVSLDILRNNAVEHHQMTLDANSNYVFPMPLGEKDEVVNVRVQAQKTGYASASYEGQITLYGKLTPQNSLSVTKIWSSRSTTNNYISAIVVDQNGNIVKDAKVSAIVSYGTVAAKYDMVFEPGGATYYVATLPLLETNQTARVTVSAEKAGYASATASAEVTLYGTGKPQFGLTITGIWSDNSNGGYAYAKVVDADGTPATPEEGTSVTLLMEWGVRNLTSRPSPYTALGYVAYWPGKVNQHRGVNGAWQTDPDGVSGGDIYPVEYCQKWFPGSHGAYDIGYQYIEGWKTRGNNDNYNENGVVYQCIAEDAVSFVTYLGRPMQWRHICDPDMFGTISCPPGITPSQNMVPPASGGSTEGGIALVTMSYDPASGYYRYSTYGMFASDTTVRATAKASKATGNQQANLTQTITIYGSNSVYEIKISDIWSDNSNGGMVYAKVLDSDGTPALPEEGTQVAMTLQPMSTCPGGSMCPVPPSSRVALSYDSATGYYGASTVGLYTLDTPVQATATATKGSLSASLSKSLMIYGTPRPTAELTVVDIWSDRSDGGMVYAKVIKQDGTPATPQEGTRVKLSIAIPCTTTGNSVTCPSQDPRQLEMRFNSKSGYYEYPTKGIFKQDTKVSATVTAYKSSVLNKASLTKVITIYGEEQPPWPPSGHTLELYKGWNMISAPDDGLTLEDIKSACDVRSKLWYYNGSQYVQAPEVKMYPSSTPLVAGQGYWIKVSTGCKVESDGKPFDGTGINMHAGWNQIGALSQDSKYDAEASTCTITSGPWYYKPAPDNRYVKSSLDELMLGMGYWVKVSQLCTLAFGDGMPPAPPTDNAAAVTAQATIGQQPTPMQEQPAQQPTPMQEQPAQAPEQQSMPSQAPVAQPAVTPLGSRGSAGAIGCETTGKFMLSIGSPSDYTKMAGRERNVSVADFSKLIGGVKIKLSDVSTAIGTSNIHPAIIDILDSSGTVIKQVQINPDTTDTETINGVDYKIHTYQINPGIFLNTKWAEIEFSTCSG